ncbi:hypothetical protein CDD80_716 [Ophiocordyceps camponoti-rufipedis]|uniref:Amidase domain-containing protein n=1 Tax=Ophiocordyceps camponoti-rufipedis TaxID=2004952 RepID=A0A2C5Z672_9HYPO|nr:hypothetical protein CDD80_716 [Ophiocordyceps camponoti-rufipedis]
MKLVVLLGLFHLAGALKYDACQSPLQLLDATLDELREGLDGGCFTSVDLVKAYMSRINDVNDVLHAVNEINPDALDEAKRLDKDRKRMASSKPLYGIPILIKDNIATFDQMNNTAGSLALVGARVPEDSGVVSRLRKAGAIILGKTNLSEWANFRSSNSTNGWSAYGGQAVGAYFQQQDPSGSSSGSAIAASIGLAWATLGTETSGSIVSPAERNNVVGIKPTVGLTSRYLVVPISQRRDTVGPIARTVKDAASLLAVVAGRDERDNYTDAIPPGALPDYVAACTDNGLQGRRIGVPRALDGRLREPVREAFNKALDILRGAGAEVIQDIDMPGLTDESDPSVNVLGADMKADLPTKYLSKLTTNPQNITSLADLRAFTQREPREEFPFRDTAAWDSSLSPGAAEAGSALYWAALNAEIDSSGPRGITGALANQSLDALVGTPDLLSGLASSLGTPLITVPLGRFPDDSPFKPSPVGPLNRSGPNRPFGLAFAGDRFGEEALIGMACAFEARGGGRDMVKPVVKPETDLGDVLGRKEEEQVECNELNPEECIKVEATKD